MVYRCEAVVSGCDAAPVFDAADHPLDGVSLAIADRGEGRLPAAVDPGRDVRGSAAISLMTDHETGEVAIIKIIESVG